jgi:hypothetical protein
LEIFLIWILAFPATHLSFSRCCFANHQVPMKANCAAQTTFTTLGQTLPTLPVPASGCSQLNSLPLLSLLLRSLIDAGACGASLQKALGLASTISCPIKWSDAAEPTFGHL